MSACAEQLKTKEKEKWVPVTAGQPLQGHQQTAEKAAQSEGTLYASVLPKAIPAGFHLSFPLHPTPRAQLDTEQPAHPINASNNTN